MRRILLEKLLYWKNDKNRKPLLLDGARQVGKSYLLEREFGEKYFSKVHKFDFREDPDLENIFKESLRPMDIIRSLELKTEEKIDFEKDLIFFDEIGECQHAVDSLKYFCEKMTHIYLCASGSNIGLLNSFPVGKVYNLELFPMNFYEFLLASDEKILIEEFENQSNKTAAHEKLWKKLLDYYFVGGMPEAVQVWFSDLPLLDKLKKISDTHSNLISGYKRDFGKYGGKENPLHIESVFLKVPSSLQEVIDDSVKRFSFKGVIKNKKRYLDLLGPISWLEKSKLISKNHIVNSKPSSPLATLSKENIFKLFFFDIGLLGNILGITYQEVLEQKLSFKGFIAENFVQNELRVIGEFPTYSWKEQSSEIEFILKSRNGDFYPLEIKSGKRTRAKSLSVYRDKYMPLKNIKLSGNKGNEDKESIRWPLYYTCYLYKVLN